MTGKPKLLEVGDVIRANDTWASTSFSFHYMKPEKDKPIAITECFRYYSKAKKNRLLAHRVSVAAGDDTSITKNLKGSPDFIVVGTSFSGGGYGHGAGDYYPNGHHVEARQLKADGTYDPKGQKIEFYQSGCFICKIEKIKPVRKMRFV
jgi:hypothetical protein